MHPGLTRVSLPLLAMTACFIQGGSAIPVETYTKRPVGGWPGRPKQAPGHDGAWRVGVNAGVLTVCQPIIRLQW